MATLCFALPVSSISVKGGERKALSGFISIILLGRTLSRVSTSLKVISCEHFQLFNLVSAKHDIHHQRLFGTVRGDESFLAPFKKNEEVHFFPSDVSNGLFTFLVGQTGQYFVYPYFVKSKNKLLIALFFPLIGLVVKIISRICVQRLYNIAQPGYSYTLLVPLYYGSAIIFRALQADLDSLENIAIIGIIHGAAEVIERSTMVFIDHMEKEISSLGKFPYSSP